MATENKARPPGPTVEASQTHRKVRNRWALKLSSPRSKKKLGNGKIPETPRHALQGRRLQMLPLCGGGGGKGGPSRRAGGKCRSPGAAGGWLRTNAQRSPEKSA